MAGGGAAFFDLDRTLVRGASGPVFSDALRTAGVVGRQIPGERLLYRFFDLVGETLPAMFLTRQLARFAAGWDRVAVREAGMKAAAILAGDVPGFARVTIDEHRAAGRPVVLTTTTPLDLVEPLAELLGFDGIVATRYETRNGHYTGQITGEFVWGPGKLAAVRTWAANAGVDLHQSWAYSDSFFDVPLLSNVGQPVALNPDARLWAVATARRWPIQYFDVPPGVVKLGPVELQRMLQLLARPELFPWVRSEIDGLDHIPHRGPALLVANHRSYLDPLVIGYTLAQVGRAVRFLGKKEVLDAPVVGQVARALGTIRVDRATGSDEPLEAAAAALTAGELVAIMPQGTIPRGRAFFDPVLRGRWGAARLAAQTKVPVVPMGLWGTELAWPRSSRLPNVLAIGHPPTVQVRVGSPVELAYRSVKADTERIMEAITALLPEEARVAREPTAEEIARAMPPGHHDQVEATTEAARRPGTD